MIKNIKRVGIIFLAIAIICLMTIGCLSINSVASSGNNVCNLSSDKSETAISNSEFNSDTIADTEFVPDIILKADESGTLETKWNQAVDLSKTENREVFVRLDQDWSAELIAGTTSFGTGSGFYGGALYISAGINIKLDLNGYTIDRCLGASVSNGSAILVRYGTFTLMDNKYESKKDEIYNAYNKSANKEIDFRSIISGKIVGGYADGQGGGGIYVVQGTFTMQSGMICNNNVDGQGGGILIGTHSKATILDGVIANNVSYFHDENAGGIFVVGSSTLDIYNGIVYGNIGIDKVINSKSSPDGAGMIVNGINSSLNIHNGIFSKNKTLYGGGGVGGALLIINQGTANITGGLFEYNIANNGGGIGTWNGTLNLSNARIENNYADETSGGVYLPAISDSIANIKNTIIANNSAKRNCAGLSVQNNRTTIGSGVQIYDNFIFDMGNICNMKIALGKNIIIEEELVNTKIGITLQGNGEYTTGYSAHNGSTDPNNYFFSDLIGEIVHLNSAGELEQAKTIASSKYDYIYLENNVRKSYKENGLIHGNNDFDKKQSYNGGKLILGKVSANTSVNQFVANINFGNAVISLLNAKGEIVYGKNADSKFADKLNNSIEYAVGTGWKLKVYTTAGDLIDEISISVLGDLTGDGKVNSADVNRLRQMVANSEVYANSSEVVKLSSLIINNGKTPTNADAEILWNVVCGKIDIADFI